MFGFDFCFENHMTKCPSNREILLHVLDSGMHFSLSAKQILFDRKYCSYLDLQQDLTAKGPALEAGTPQEGGL